MKRIVCSCILLILFKLTWAQIDLSQGLVAHYPFNGNANDQSGQGNDGTVNGAILSSDRFGNASGAYYFDGINDFIEVFDHTSLDLTAGITLSVWYWQAEASGKAEQLLAKGGDTPCNYSLMIPGEGEVFSYGRHNMWTSWSTGTAAGTGSWNHLVLSYESGNLAGIKAYLNNTEISLMLEESTAGAALIANDLILTIGCYNAPYYGGYKNFYKGRLDDLRIYNRVLEREEVDSLYHENDWDSLSYGLWADYPFDGNADDEGWHNFDGSVNGPAPAQDRFGDNSGALYFNGINNYVSTSLRFSDHFNTGDPVLISGWFRTTQEPITGTFILGGNPGGGPEFMIYLQNSGKIRVRLYNCSDPPLSDKKVNDDQWHHVAFGWDNDTSTFYVDGIRQSNLPGNLGSYVQNDYLWFGARNSSGITDCFEGRTDDLKIFHRSLTEAEILQLYANYHPPSFFSVKTGDRQVMLSWSPERWADLNKVYIYRDNDLLDSLTIDDISDTTFTDKELDNGQVYTYFIRSVDEFGNISISSDTLSVIPVIIADGLACLYPFTGNANDQSGNRNDGTVNNALLTADRFGNHNSAFDFDGNDDYISIPYVMNNHFTCALWFRKEGIGGTESEGYTRLIDFNTDNPHLAVKEDNEFLSWYSPLGPVWRNVKQIKEKQWYFVVLSYDGDDFKYYLNGETIDEVNYPGYEITGNITIGSRYNLQTEFNGLIDDIRIYDHSLEESEIQQLYANYHAADTFYVQTGNQLVTLFWDTINWSYKDKVFIYRNGSLIDSLEINNITDTSYTDSSLTNDQNYTYFIRSSDIFGNLSISSDTISVAPSEFSGGLVAWYPFNGNAGDESGDRYHGTITGPVLAADRFIDSEAAYLFDGTDDYIYTPLQYSPHFASGDTIQFSCWFKTSQNPGSPRFIIGSDQSSPEFAVTLEPGGHIGVRLYACAGQATSDHILNDNRWHHLTFGWDGDTSVFYIDGIRQASLPANIETYTGNDHLWFGARNAAGSSDFFEGSIDDFRLFSRSLTETEVYRLYANYYPPDAFRVHTGNGQVTLGWDTAGLSALSAIYVYRNNLLLESIEISGIDDTLYTDATVVNGNYYTYFIKSKDTLGNASTTTDTLSVTPVQLEDELIAIYPFTGDAEDESGNGHHATNYGATLTMDRYGNPNRAYLFNGSNNNMNLGSGFDLESSSFSFSFWEKHASAGGNLFNQGTPGDNQYLNIKYEPGGSFGFRFQNNDLVTSATFLETGEWRHWVCTFDNASRSRYIYLNGDTVAHDTATALYTGTGELFLGSQFNGSEYYPGTVDDIYIYNRPLSWQEVLQLYANHHPPDSFAVKPGKSQVTLSWSPKRWERLDTIFIYRNNSLYDTVPFEAEEDAIYIDQGVLNNVTYEYFIISKDTSGYLSISTDTLEATPQTLYQDLAAWYPLNGNGNDMSGQENNAAESGVVIYPEDRFGEAGHAAAFDGINDYFSTPTFTFGTDSFAVSAWVKPVPGNDSIQVIISRDSTDGNANGDITLQIDTTGNVGNLPYLRFARYEGGAWSALETSTTLNYDRWQHVACTWDRNTNSSKPRIFINGIEAEYSGVQPVWDSITPNPSPVWIGARDGISVTDSLHFSGALDEIRIYSRALTLPEIRQLYANYYPPEGFTVTPGDRNVTLSWDSAGLTWLKGINVYRDNSLIATLPVSGPSDTSYKDTGLINGQSHTYFITSADQLENSSISSDTISAAPTLVPAGLEAWYPFTGNADDQSGNGFDGTVNGAMLQADRYDSTNSAYYFDGNDYISLAPLTLDTGYNTSVSAWFRCYSDSAMILADTTDALGAFCIFYHSNGKIEGSITNSSSEKFTVLSQAIPDDSSWNHVVLCRDETSLFLYLNGRAADSVEITGYTRQGSGIVVGRNGTSPTLLSFNGLIDDVRIYNRTLTAADCHRLYSNYHAPDTLTAEADTSVITLRWSAEGIEGLSSYRIFRDNILADSIEVISGNDTVFTDTELNSGVIHKYHIQSVDTAGFISRCSDTIEAAVLGLVAYYPFTSGALDAGANMYHATLLGGATIQDFLVTGNNAVDAVSIPYSVVNKLGDFTITANIRINTAHTGSGQLNTMISGANVSTADALLVGYHTESHSWNLSINQVNAVFNNSVIEDKRWHQLVVQRNWDSSLIYIDGVLADGTKAINSDPVVISPGGLIIGQDQDAVGSGFNATQSLSGNLYDLRIYNYLLTEAEIDSLVNLNQWEPVDFEWTAVNTTGMPGHDGSVTIDAVTGIGPFTYLWSTGDTTTSIHNLSEGLYTVTVTDARDSTATDSIRIWNTIRDSRDGRRYKVVWIGDQIWMAENLSYRTVSGSWYYDNDSATYHSLYGRLYDWPTANTTCPEGWELPSDTAWITLEEWLGMTPGTADDPGWRQTNNEGDSLTSEIAVGFNALWAGKRDADGSFNGLGTQCYFWTSDVYDAGNGWYRELESGNHSIGRGGSPNDNALSVRCIMSDPEISFITNHTSGLGEDDGSVEGNITGGQPPFSYLWSNGSTDTIINGLKEGVYSLTVTDARGIMISDSIRVYDKFNDSRDGNTYKAIKIGNQIWMGEDLNFGNYIEGGNIQEDNQVPEKYCYSDDPTKCSIYGGLYLWDEMMQYASSQDGKHGTRQGICPIGWHIPTNMEVSELEIFVGMSPNAIDSSGLRGANEGGKLKETDTIHWQVPNTEATDKYGFRLLPNGRIISSGAFENLGTTAGFWTASKDITTNPFGREVWYNDPRIGLVNNIPISQNQGLAVRCILDSTDYHLTPAHTTGIGRNDGSVNLEIPVKKFPPYTYLWSNGATTEDIEHLYSGLYKVIITDELGITITDSIRIYDTFIDARDNEEYKAVRIGNQVWMAENLRYGTLIDTTFDQSNNDTIEKYCYLNQPGMCDSLGGYYQWWEMMQYNPADNAVFGTTQGICPAGWHVPTDEEWKSLEKNTGMVPADANAEEVWRGTQGDSLKYGGATGFDALLAGDYNHNDHHWELLAEEGIYWTASELDANNTWMRRLHKDQPGIFRGKSQHKEHGRSVRCIRSLVDIRITGYNTSGLGYSDGSAKIEIDFGLPPYHILWSTGETKDSIYGLYAGVYAAEVTDSLGTIVRDSIRIFDTFIDERDTVRYKVVKIGEQIWMAENLKATRYTDGTSMVDGTGIGDISGDDSTKYWFVYNDSISYKDIYGLLYHWAAVMNGSASSDLNPSRVQGICPTDWHVPSDNEWKELEMYLGMNQATADGIGWRGTIEGGKMKETGIDHWISPNTGANNESGFTAIPEGSRGTSESFNYISLYSVLWSTTISENNSAWSRSLGYSTSQILRDNTYTMDVAFSVRCVRDPLNIEFEPTHTTGFGFSDGSITLTVKSGIPPFSYLWSTGETTKDIDSLSAGVYAVTVTDAHDVSVTDSIRIFDTFTDKRDTTVYKVIVIGNHLWMAENLKTTRYTDGASMVNGIGAGDISGDDSTKYWFAFNDSISHKDIYGLLYSWAAVMNGSASSDLNPSGVQGVCPTDWHVPSDAECTELTDYLGGLAVAGGKMKEAGTTHWYEPNTGADNSSGFTALPGALRSNDGSFYNLGKLASFWSSTEYLSSNAWHRELIWDVSKVNRTYHGKDLGFSVRCVRDPLNIEFDSVQNTSVINGQDGFIDLLVRGGIPPFIYSWSNGSITEDIDSILAGMYTVTVTDTVGAWITDSVRVYDTFLDERDNDRYKAIIIGKQLWMAENLNYGNKINGSENQTDNSIPEKYCYNDSLVYCDTYGGLYQWDEMMGYDNTPGHQGICPVGWKLPTDDDWKQLEIFVGMDPGIVGNTGWRGTDEGGKLKSEGTEYWTDPNVSSTNLYGFSVMPGGLRNVSGGFIGIKSGSNLATSTMIDVNFRCSRKFAAGDGRIYRALNSVYKEGHSVRCLKIIDTLVIELVTIKHCSSLFDSGGAITIKPHGGLDPYDILWSTGDVTETIDSLPSGVYTVTVTDILGNSATDSFRIYNSFTDERDNTRYKVIWINEQLWMAENLNYYTPSGSWYYEDDSSSWSSRYGRLYDWITAMNIDSTYIVSNYLVSEPHQGVCPLGWHIPTDPEWKNLEEYLGMDPSAADTTGWRGTDQGTQVKEEGSSGLEILLAGYRSVSGEYKDTNQAGWSWTTSNTDSLAYHRMLNIDETGIDRGLSDKTSAMSVRCIRNYCVIDSIKLIADSANCFGFSDGFINLTVIPEGAHYHYSWSNGDTTQDIDSLTKGTYIVTVTDTVFCSLTGSITVSQPDSVPPPGASNLSLCDGQSECLEATGTDIKWYEEPSHTSPSVYTGNVFCFDYPSTGIWKFYATQTIAGCESEVSTATLIVKATPEANVADDQVFCLSERDTVSLGATPVAGCSYEWSSKPAGLDTTEPNPEVCPDKTTTYYLTVTLDSTNCSATDSVTITVYPDPVIESIDTFLCRNNTGYINISVTGGKQPYHYMWSNDSTTEDISVSYSDDYVVIVSDDHSCTATDTIHLTETYVPPPEAQDVTICYGSPDPAVLTAEGMNIKWYFNDTLIHTGDTLIFDYTSEGIYLFQVTQTPDICESYPVSVTLTVHELPVACTINDTALCWSEAQGIQIGCNSVSGYSYNWTSTPPGFNSTEANPKIYPDTTTIYTLTVTIDTTGCKDGKSVTVTVYPNPAVSLIDTFLCRNNNGYIDILVTGGTQPYHYMWSNDSTTEDISVSASDDYVVIVSDYHSCTATDTIHLTETYVAPPEAQDVTICFGYPDPAVLTAEGMNIKWYFNDTPIHTGNTLTFDYDTAGTYLFHVTQTPDICESYPVTVTLVVHDTPEACIIKDTSLCKSEAQKLMICCDSTPGYSYEWTFIPSGIPISAACAIISPDVTTACILKVNNSDGCFDYDTSIITVHPDPVIDFMAKSDSLCPGSSDGFINISVTGGTPSFNYLWSNGGTTKDIDSLDSGEYTVIVTDAFSCTATDTYHLAEKNVPLPGVEDNSICDGDSAILTAQGINIRWYDMNDSLIHTGDTLVFNYDTTGIYYFHVTQTPDTCESNTDTVMLIVHELPEACTINDSALCWSEAQGLPVGCDPVTGYSYAWTSSDSNEFISPESNPMIYPDTTTAYFLKVTDTNLCSDQDTFVITVYPNPVIGPIIKSNTLCPGSMNGFINITVTGGTEPYSYQWSNGAVTPNINELDSGIYIITITDSNNCHASKSCAINEYNIPDSLVQDTSICYGESVTLTANGVNIKWYKDGSLKFSGNPYVINEKLNTGIHLYLVTQTVDTCPSKSDTLLLTINRLPDVLVNIDAEFCNSDSFEYNIGGDYQSPENSYLWNSVPADEFDHNIPDPVVRPDETTSYFLTVTDTSTECFARDSVTVTILDDPPVSVSPPDTLITANDTIILMASGAVDEKYSWFPDNYEFEYLEPDSVAVSPDKNFTYIVTGWDENNCRGTDSSVISVYCHECIDRTFPADTGSVSYGSGCYYNPNDTCEWRISYCVKGTISLWFSTFDLKQGDTLYLYANGSKEPDSSYYLNHKPPDTLTVKFENGFKMRFISDGTGEGSGFRADYWLSDACDHYIRVDETKATPLKIYPNPFTYSTIIEFPNPDFEPYRLILTDLSGKVLRTVGEITGSRYELKRENLTNGFYLIELVGSKVYRGRIIIE